MGTITKYHAKDAVYGTCFSIYRASRRYFNR